ncbi:hypothetical protein EV424DRAFT_1573989 [Suillus variegatus]|nr:hypothetical protein EV424DRAFT_1573989 [Suillus variegatus]
MKDKEPTSLKTLSQNTRPYPSTPRLPSQTPRTGPHFFPPNVIQDDDTMEESTNFLPDSPSSPDPQSPPDTPTPIPRTICELPQHPDSLVYQEFKVITTAEAPAVNAPSSDLNSSIHAPNNVIDQTMSAPLSPTATRPRTAEEEAILAHLALAETNRSILSQNGPNHNTTLPQFTPTPIGGFPRVHMAHSAQIFDHLDNKVLLAWFQVEHPKLMVRAFDLSGKDIADKTAAIAERLRASINMIADYSHKDTPPIQVSPPQPQGGKSSREFPVGFLVHSLLVLRPCTKARALRPVTTLGRVRTWMDLTAKAQQSVRVAEDLSASTNKQKLRTPCGATIAVTDGRFGVEDKLPKVRAGCQAR